MEKNKRILVVDDEETLCEALKFNLEEEGFEVDTALSAEEALCLDLASYNLVILDIMMGEISGTRLAGIMKSKPETAAIPIIFCTARDSEDEMIKGLDLGADDYITKPYSIRNIIARVKAVLRRSTAIPEKPSHSISFEGLTVDPVSKTCSVDGQYVKMPRKEFEILLTLLKNRGRIFSREELLNLIWPDEVVVVDRVVDVNITRIRRKIGRYGSHITTRSGYGYGFVD
ncbi:MAG TPA: DNA-binding response regulator [Porphyromonadaceae bacterium]|nr:response regulator transcription factor [Paramuribaculum sp.]HAB41701.1 DNA-binding response regulator [Porphyromonadaceae bacterium]